VPIHLGMDNPLPTLGRIVHYRGRVGKQTTMRAALVSCTVDSLAAEGVEQGLIPPLSSPTHVHLHVFTPSSVGAFVEYDVPRATGSTIEPGQWGWPKLR